MLILKDYKKYIDEMEYKDFVLIDPPWSYDDIRPGLLTNQLNYTLWNNEEGLDYIFKNIKSDHLGIWVTNSFLLNVFNQNHYNYTYKTVLTWVKTTSKNNIACGLGNTLRNSTEHLLFFTKKKVKPLRLSLRTVILEQSGKRTEKPKNFETILFNNLQIKGHTKFSYIFCGLNITPFENFNIDLVDIEKC